MIDGNQTILMDCDKGFTLRALFGGGDGVDGRVNSANLTGRLGRFSFGKFKIDFLEQFLRLSGVSRYVHQGNQGPLLAPLLTLFQLGFSRRGGL